MTIDCEEKIRKQWEEFLNQDLPRIEAALKEERWIWEPVESDEEPSSQSERFMWGEGDIEITQRADEPEPPNTP